MADLSLPPEVLASLAAKRLGFTTSADTARQQSNQSLTDQLYQLDQNNRDQTRNIDDTFADRGTFNSGIRVDSQGRLARNIGEQRGQLQTAHSNSLANIQNALDAELAGLQDQQSQYALDFNRTQSTQALADAQNQSNAGNTDLQAQIDALQGQIVPPAAPQVDSGVGTILGILGSQQKPPPVPVNKGRSFYS